MGVTPRIFRLKLSEISEKSLIGFGGLFLSLGLAYLSYRFYETPFLRLKNRFQRDAGNAGNKFVFPAHAGVNRSAASPSAIVMSFPRTRGGEPNDAIIHFRDGLFSPHTRG